MKTQDYLILGSVAVGAYFLFKSDFGKGLESGFSGIGEAAGSVGQTAGQVGGTLEDTSKFVRRNVNNIEEYATDIIEIPKKFISASNAIAGKSLREYVASQPVVLNPSVGTRKNIQLARSRGITSLPLIVKSPSGNIKKTMVNIQSPIQRVVSAAKSIPTALKQAVTPIRSTPKKSQSIRKK